MANFSKSTTHFSVFHEGSPSSRSYREEKRDRSGLVRGHYGFMDPDGVMHRYAYEADAFGYR